MAEDGIDPESMGISAETKALLGYRSHLDNALMRMHTEQLEVAESACESYCTKLDYYLQLSTLLDPIVALHTAQLCEMIESRLVAVITDAPSLKQERVLRLLEIPCQALYSLAKVRREKPLSSQLPHQVRDLRFLLPALIFVEENVTQPRSWFLRYIIFIWSSVAVRIPFPLNTVFEDATVAKAVDVSTKALTESSRVADAAASFLARFIARRDAVDYRVRLITSSVSNVLTSDADTDTIQAALLFLAVVFKLAHRDDLRPFASDVLDALQNIPLSTTVIAHRFTKLVQRVALVFLPARAAAWRYERKTKRLFSKKAAAGNVDSMSRHTDVDDEGDFTDLPEERAVQIEGVIDMLLDGLHNRDTAVRWSAAKGIGRITSKLPLSLAQDVADSILAFFRDHDEARADAVCHGACLAVAEMARRGIILPDQPQFAAAFAAIEIAARFDQRRGATGVGAHVRDAACYAVWAFARAYDGADVKPYADVIIRSMVPVTLLDREVNCRRAGAAALQECVGRLAKDVFPNGIGLITTADFFSVGDRSASYEYIAPKIAALASREYFDCLVKELSERKLFHWDPVVRALAAKSIAALVPLDQNGTMISPVVPELVLLAMKRGDVVIRHGAVLGLVELANIRGLDVISKYIDEICSIPLKLSEKAMFSGRSGDNVRLACCALIKSVATAASFAYLRNNNGRNVANQTLVFLERVLSSGVEDLYSAATEAYKAMCANVVSTDESWHIELAKRILAGIENRGHVQLQRGFVKAAGACGECPVSDDIAKALSGSVTLNPDVEVRRNAAMSLCQIPSNSIIRNLITILQALADGMHDYAVDDRGDIGSWVREASMTTAAKIAEDSIRPNLNLLQQESKAMEDAVLKLLCSILKQCAGRIDRTRATAGSVLKVVCNVFGSQDGLAKISTVCTRLITFFGFTYEIDQPSEGLGIVDSHETEEVNFSELGGVYKAIRRSVEIAEIRDAALSSMVMAAGGARVHARASLAAILSIFSDATEQSARTDVLLSLASLLQDTEEKLTVPTLKVISAVMRSGAVNGVNWEVLSSLIKSIRDCWHGKLNNIPLIATAVLALEDVAALSVKEQKFVIGEGSPAEHCLKSLVVVLGMAIPRLRRVAAESIYMILIQLDLENEAESLTIALDMLTDTPWLTLPRQEVRTTRNTFCNLLGIQAPQVVSKASTSATS